MRKENGGAVPPPADGVPGGNTGAPPPPVPPQGTPIDKQLPPGTYPGRNAPPATAQLPDGVPPMMEQKPVRAGTITMALSLIIIGVLLVARVFTDQLDYVLIARLSPLVLVGLGLEILVASLRHRDKRIRLNVGSVIVSLVLIMASMVAVAVPELIIQELQQSRTNDRLRDELTQAGYEATKGNAPKVDNMEWYLNVSRSNLRDGMRYSDLGDGDYVQVRVYLKNEYASAAEFAADCRRVADKVLALVPGMDYMSFYSYNPNGLAGLTGPERYSLWLEGPWQMNESAAELAARVEVEYWFEQEQRYVSADEDAYQYILDPDLYNEHYGLGPEDMMDEPDDAPGQPDGQKVAPDPAWPDDAPVDDSDADSSAPDDSFASLPAAA